MDVNDPDRNKESASHPPVEISIIRINITNNYLRLSHVFLCPKCHDHSISHQTRDNLCLTPFMFNAIRPLIMTGHINTFIPRMNSILRLSSVSEFPGRDASIFRLRDQHRHLPQNSSAPNQEPSHVECSNSNGYTIKGKEIYPFNFQNYNTKYSKLKYLSHHFKDDKINSTSFLNGPNSNK
ncbi:hypothetical protein HZS_5247, partial [Henneguya salminicola]